MTRRRKILVAAVLVGAAFAAAVSLLPERASNAVTSLVLVFAWVLIAADFVDRRRKRKKATVTDPKAQMAEALMQITDLTRQINEAVDGYRSDCERRGYSPTASEAMALELHHSLLRAAFKS
jgi:ABC-type uncharacterized transport system permease subunit